VLAVRALRACYVAAQHRSRALRATQMKGVEVTDQMMDAVGDMQLVESVTLLSGGPDNGFTCAPAEVHGSGPCRSLTSGARRAQAAGTHM
jgi:hypothetical protein